MRTDVLKAVVAMESFFTYNIAPEEFYSLLLRIEPKDDRDKSIIESLAYTIDKFCHK